MDNWDNKSRMDNKLFNLVSDWKMCIFVIVGFQTDFLKSLQINWLRPFILLLLLGPGGEGLCSPDHGR
jgi:hypothetical protein